MGSVRHFWRWCEERRNDPLFDKENAPQAFLAYRLTVQKRDSMTVTGDYSALQWFYKYVLNREWDVKKIRRPKREKRLPRTISF